MLRAAENIAKTFFRFSIESYETGRSTSFERNTEIRVKKTIEIARGGEEGMRNTYKLSRRRYYNRTYDT